VHKRVLIGQLVGEAYKRKGNIFYYLRHEEIKEAKEQGSKGKK